MRRRNSLVTCLLLEFGPTVCHGARTRLRRPEAVGWLAPRNSSMGAAGPWVRSGSRVRTHAAALRMWTSKLLMMQALRQPSTTSRRCTAATPPHETVPIVGAAHPLRQCSPSFRWASATLVARGAGTAFTARATQASLRTCAVHVFARPPRALYLHDRRCGRRSTCGGRRRTRCSTRLTRHRRHRRRVGRGRGGTAVTPLSRTEHSRLRCTGRWCAHMPTPPAALPSAPPGVLC